eukprot:GILI01008842.1.p1 GENE.GILI01008842.1~~GILI01008842.1.p1  ORF type:complete len:629 (-),score=101.35 GILI01008842.1:208-2070(-)
MMRPVQSALDPNSADYFPQSQQYRSPGSGMVGAAAGQLQGHQGQSPYSSRGLAMPTNAGIFTPPHTQQFNSIPRAGAATYYYPTNNNLPSNTINSLGMYSPNAGMPLHNRTHINSRPNIGMPAQGMVFTPQAVNHTSLSSSPGHNRQGPPQPTFGQFSNISAQPIANNGGDFVYPGSVVPLPRSKAPGQVLQDSVIPTVVDVAPVDEWAGSDTPKLSPAVASDQFQNIFATLLADGADASKTQISSEPGQLQRPAVSALNNNHLCLNDDEDLTNLIAQIEVKRPDDDAKPSPDPRYGSAGSGTKYTSSPVLPEESPPIHITATAFLPTPDASPSLPPANLRGGLEPSPLKSASEPMLPNSAAQIAQMSKPNSGATSVSNGSIAAPKTVDQTPSPNSDEAESGAITPPADALAKPNLASLVAGTARPAAPPKGSMAEKLAAMANKSGSNPPPAFAPKAPSAIATSPTSYKGLPTNKAGVEKFLRDGDAPETLRHIKILAFATGYQTEIKALFELWAGNGIPPPDDAFGAYYWYVRKKLGRDLCMKHNGPGKAPGVGYGGCDYAGRGQGQCRYFHQCLFCTKEDHGWFDEGKCGRFKTYQKELGKLRLSEDQVYELVAAYGK